jgi:alkaline phosphatase
MRMLTAMQRQTIAKLGVLFSTAVLVAGCTPTAVPINSTTPQAQPASNTGNVIFIHPDGTSPAHWGAARFLYYGPDARLNWDRMSNLAIYLGHMKNQLSGTSNAGGVTHATGVKAQADSMGFNENGKAIVAASGKSQTIMQEAISQNFGTAIINSGIISEAGTAAFLAKVNNRREHAEITKQMVESGADVILGGGEVWYLPKGKAGRHATAQQSQRTDNLNLIEFAKGKGYTIVYTRDELLSLPKGTQKVLGIFAAEDTYNDDPEEILRAKKQTPYIKNTPAVSEMLQVSLRVLSEKNRPFFVVLEEEGTDNFCNANNASGCLEAVKRADDAIGVGMNFIGQHPNTLLVTAADSNAGGLEIVGAQAKEMDPNKPLAARGGNGAPWDGRDGTRTLPFLAAPDAMGQRFPFAIAWSSFGDNAGSIVAKAHGLNASMLHGTIDNTDIYRLMYATLFGKMPSAKKPAAQ